MAFRSFSKVVYMALVLPAWRRGVYARSYSSSSVTSSSYSATDESSHKARNELPDSEVEDRRDLANL